MPRRKGQAAELAVQNESFNRWRILLRHQKFQKNLNWLRSQYRTWVKGPPITQYTYEFDSPDLDEFGTEIPRQIKSKISRKDVDLFNECDPNDPMVGVPAGAWRNFNSKWGINLPKAALSDALPDLRQDTINQWTAIPSKEPAIVPFPVNAGTPRTNWLKLVVNLSYPRDILIERIEKELSNVMQQGRKARRRWDKFDYYLQVYDLAVKSETFRAIAQTLKRRVSTVKSAYLAIVKTIYFCDSTGLRRIHAHRDRALPNRKALVLMSLDHKTHFSHCEDCKSAQTADEMCQAMQTCANQDYRGQRELLASDWIDKV